MGDPVSSDALGREARRAGVPLPSDAVGEALLRHLALLYAWNRRFNLTSIRDPEVGLRRHLVEALCGLAELPDVEEPGPLLVDLGSGNGYPALPLLIARPDLRGLLVDASSRKADFLRAACRTSGCLGRVDVRHARIASLAEIPEEASIITLRAFPDPSEWIAASARRPATRLVLAWLSSRDAASIARSVVNEGRSARVVPLPTREDAALLSVRPADPGF